MPQEEMFPRKSQPSNFKVAFKHYYQTCAVNHPLGFCERVAFFLFIFRLLLALLGTLLFWADLWNSSASQGSCFVTGVFEGCKKH